METKLVTIIMGSKSDWPVMEYTAKELAGLHIGYEARVLSAHRTPQALFDYVEGVAANGIEIIIAAAGGAAHLPGVIASKTVLPVIGVPMQTSALNGMDSLLSIVQMPAGIPVATMAIGKAGAINAAIYAASILSLKYPAICDSIKKFRKEQSDMILEHSHL